MSAELIEPHAFFDELGAAVKKHRKDFSKPWRIAFRLAEGPCYLVDVASDRGVSRVWAPDADATMLVDLRTLTAMVNGELDANEPKPGQVCVCTGKLEALAELTRFIGPGKFDARI